MSHPEAPIEPVKIILAGAHFEVTQGQALGSFHAIPISLWACIVGFQREVALRHHAEAITLHRWHKGEQRYHSMIPFQTTRSRGLVVNYSPSDPKNTALFDAYGLQYKEDFSSGMLTIHSHVDSTSFESGQDAHDERSLPGWHCTLGRLITGKEYHLDFRMRLPHTPKVRTLLDPDSAYKLDYTHLFAEGVTRDQVYQCPGSLAWAKYIERVKVI